MPGGGRFNAGKHFHHGGFTRTIFSDQHVDLISIDPVIDSSQGGYAGIDARQAAGFDNHFGLNGLGSDEIVRRHIIVPLHE